MTTSVAQERGEAFPWTIDLEWFGVHGIHSIDGERLAKITLVEAGRGDAEKRGGQFTGFRVAILSRRRGELDTTTVFFADTMAPLEVGGRKVEPHISSFGGWRWHQGHSLPEPDTTGVVAAVERIIDHWR